MIRSLLQLFPYVRELETALDKSHEDLTKALCGEITIESIVANRKSCKVELGTKIASFFGASFYDMLDELKAENYVEISFLAPDGKPVTVTVRRYGGKTPDQLYKETLDRAEKAEAKLEFKHEFGEW